MGKKSTPRVTQTTQTINLDINWEKVLAMVIPLTCTYIHQLVKFAFSHLNPCKNSGVHSFNTRNRKQIDCFEKKASSEAYVFNVLPNCMWEFKIEKLFVSQLQMWL